MEKIQLVLLVDDNEADHIIAKFAFGEYREDVEILSAYDGEQALAILEKLDRLPDLILLDINMPGMDGLEFLAEYSTKQGAKAEVSMLTSSNQYSDREKCLSYDFVKEYVVKPLEVQHLHRIAKLLP